MRKLKKISSGLFLLAVFWLMIVISTNNIYADEINTKSIEFESNRVLKGVYDNTWLYFSIPDYWNAMDSTANIKIKLSPLLLDIPASLTFYFDDSPIYSKELNYVKGEIQEIEIPIDSDMLTAGTHSFHITGYARIYDEEGCIDDKTEANWTLIDKESVLKLNYSLNSCEGLKDYPYPFISSLNENGENLAIVVPDDPTEAELTAAAYIRGDLASMTDNDEIILTDQTGYSSNSTGNVIFVGIQNRLSNEVQNYLQDEGVDKYLKSDNGFVCEPIAEPNNAVLIVTAQYDDNLVSLAKAVVSKKLLSQYGRRSAWPSLSNMKKNSSTKKDTFTVGDLTNSKTPLAINGAFRQESTIYLPYKGYTLDSGGEINLTFRYSKNLDFSKSMMTVYLGQTPIASHKLKEENADLDHLKCTIPEDMTGKMLSSITLVFQLELQDTYCDYMLTSLPWASVDENSTFYLPIGSSKDFSFDSHPYPFVKAGDFEETTFVVPDSYRKDYLNLLGQVISFYAKGSSSLGDMKVIFEKNLTDETRMRNLIYVGNVSDFNKISEYMDIVPFPFDTSKDTFLGNNEMPLSSSYAEDISIWQLFASPMDDSKAVLLVLCTGDEAQSRLVKYLSEDKNRDKIVLDTVVIDKNNETKTFSFQSTIQNIERPSIRQRLEANKESVTFALVATFAMLLLLLAVILILFTVKEKKDIKKKHKRYKPKH